MLKNGIITQKWRQPISVLDQGNVEDPIIFYFTKIATIRRIVTRKMYPNTLLMILSGHLLRVFNSDIVLECHSGKTLVVNVFSDKERNEFKSAKDGLNDLEDIRCNNNDDSM